MYLFLNLIQKIAAHEAEDDVEDDAADKAHDVEDEAPEKEVFFLNNENKKKKRQSIKKIERQRDGKIKLLRIWILF